MRPKYGLSAQKRRINMINKYFFDVLQPKFMDNIKTGSGTEIKFRTKSDSKAYKIRVYINIINVRSQQQANDC